MTTTHHPDDDPAPVNRKRRRKSCLRIGATLAPLSRSIRQRLYAAMNASRHRRGPLDDQRRGMLLAAICRIADDLARHQPGHPQVLVLDAIRRRLERDLDGELADAA
jgi:hypothetical protein